MSPQQPAQAKAKMSPPWWSFLLWEALIVWGVMGQVSSNHASPWRWGLLALVQVLIAGWFVSSVRRARSGRGAR